MVNETFNKELNSHFDSVFDNAAKTMMDIAKDGNMSKSAAIAKIASAALGGL